MRNFLFVFLSLFLIGCSDGASNLTSGKWISISNKYEVRNSTIEFYGKDATCSIFIEDITLPCEWVKLEDGRYKVTATNSWGGKILMFASIEDEVLSLDTGPRVHGIVKYASSITIAENTIEVNGKTKLAGLKKESQFREMAEADVAQYCQSPEAVAACAEMALKCANGDPVSCLKIDTAFIPNMEPTAEAELEFYLHTQKIYQTACDERPTRDVNFEGESMSVNFCKDVRKLFIDQYGDACGKLQSLSNRLAPQNFLAFKDRLGCRF